ncbi:MAG: hypothetical protein IPJ69_05770 [Deltaproteobacteria bacterium]|nr:MAG: hypothetical protein IPJ69_05770 [Deltaproteobacteria bacterium]
MNIKSLPMTLLAEVLDYLADYEHFSGLDSILDEDFTVQDVRSALREIALQVRQDSDQKQLQFNAKVDFQKSEQLTTHVKSLLSSLSPTDERKLLSRFGLLES